jgi:hypothetical protein
MLYVTVYVMFYIIMTFCGIQSHGRTFHCTNVRGKGERELWGRERVKFECIVALA